jgi:hypothetical protein
VGSGFHCLRSIFLFLFLFQCLVCLICFVQRGYLGLSLSILHAQGQLLTRHFIKLNPISFKLLCWLSKLSEHVLRSRHVALRT